jgi:ribosomal protein S18 acetylase RimI-like enzyme
MNGTLVRSPLRSGTAPAGGYLVREAGAQDAGLIGDFIAGLSLSAQYFRFFTAVAPPSPSLLRVLSDSSRADLLVVIDDRGAVVGHGMAVDAAGEGVVSADVGLAIADAWQGQGLGTMLLDLLRTRAARRGVAALEFDVLSDNARMLRIIDRHWPGASRTRTADSVRIRADISTAAAPTLPTLPPAALVSARPFSYQGARHDARAHAA